MNMSWVTIYNSIVYYCCLLFMTRFLLVRKPRIWALCLSFLVFIPLIILASFGNTSFLSPAYIIFEVLQFFLIKLSFQNVKIRNLVTSYFFLYCTNMILVSLVVAIFPASRFYADYLINTAVAILCFLLCLSKIRCVVQQIMQWTPKYILIISTLLFVLTAVMFAFISGSNFFANYGLLNRALRIIFTILLFAICTALPVIILIAVSNAKLKSLTTDYEQQIHVQAEHYKNLAAANFETRRFKHDFKNISIAIEKLLADGKHEQALALLQKYNNTLNSPGIFRPGFDTGNGIADALLTDKSEKASAFNAEITFNGAIPQEYLSPTDLCVILGNTLDNAIEACQKLDFQMNKTISISCNCNSGFLFLSINNPISEKVIIHDNHIATTKENKTLHGFGLYSLHSVVKKYDGEVRLSSTDDCFTVDIDLCVRTSPNRKSCLPQ